MCKKIVVITGSPRENGNSIVKWSLCQGQNSDS